ncbi:MAG: sigma-70 family RNA polymerase sigma factor [Bacteroidota bacterium]
MNLKKLALLKAEKKERRSESISIEDFEDIYNQYSPKIFSLCLHRLNDHEVALDTVQEVFEKFWKRKDSYDSSRPLENYLITIAKNLIIDHYKKNSERQLEQSEEKTQNIHSMSPEDTLICDEQKNLALSILKKFPSRTKQIFLLSRKRGFKNREIADSLAVSEKSVEYHIAKALREMKVLLFRP